MTRVEQVMRTHERRTRKSEWAVIFKDTRLNDLRVFMQFEYLLVEYFGEIFGHAQNIVQLHNSQRPKPIITPEIGAYISDTLGWNRLENYPRWMQVRLRILRADFQVLPSFRYAPKDLLPSPSKSKSPLWGILGFVIIALAYAVLNFKGIFLKN